MKALLAAAAIGVIGLIIFFVMKVSYNNNDAKLRNLADAEQKTCMTVRDTMFNIIRDQAQLKGEYAEDLRRLIDEYVEGRGAGGGSLAKFVHENNPTLDPTITTKVMDTCEVQRSKFQTAQKKLIDVANQHQNLITTFPGSFLVSNTTPIEIKIITSSGTQRVYETGIDDENPLNAAKNNK